MSLLVRPKCNQRLAGALIFSATAVVKRDDVVVERLFQFPLRVRPEPWQSANHASKPALIFAKSFGGHDAFVDQRFAGEQLDLQPDLSLFSSVQICPHFAGGNSAESWVECRNRSVNWKQFVGAPARGECVRQGLECASPLALWGRARKTHAGKRCHNAGDYAATEFFTLAKAVEGYRSPRRSRDHPGRECVRQGREGQSSDRDS